jgi:hypothetical protein
LDIGGFLLAKEFDEIEGIEGIEEYQSCSSNLILPILFFQSYS